MLAFRAADNDSPGFRYTFDAGSARRQLKVSILVVTMLGVAIVAAALSLGLRPVGSRSYAVAVPMAYLHQAAEGWTTDRSKS